MVHKLPLLDKRYKDYKRGKAPKVMKKVQKLLKKADAYIIVSAEYNHSVPPALKNLLDHFMEEYSHKPAGIVTYSAGSFGGARVAPHLRVIVGELGMISTPSMFPIPSVGKSFDEDGVPQDEAYLRRSSRFINELVWYASTLKKARTKGVSA